MKTASIGFIREDGDFAVLATLNNNDSHFPDAAFRSITEVLTMMLSHSSNQGLVVLEREDAPDYVTLD